MAKKDDAADSFVIPSSAVDHKRIKDALNEIVGHYRVMDDEKEKIKDIVAMLLETFKIPKKLSPKLAKTLYKHNYDEVTEDNQQFEILMDTIVLAVPNAPTGPVASKNVPIVADDSE